ncbi:uncharacterized protein TRIADDRAFT_28493 [Trichoplax adhaerens]|uniref:Peptidase M14 domain-containing protein n=1 Tax=Trichoplax adhaerens TaxID=10228 RepID=B3S3S0_TRIAD|nr:hypothetical protein TRIADDRAFT_28493 [Trichoplax adhaerens]EDV22329.1 hypothetical protein TRIADDRAFT_28493 [Trichoplax adhaerens]|eukprot:XP_002114873.1 hypothetical protein TRIADDRAFT_28493 [Trichoplax adhaerens]
MASTDSCDSSDSVGDQSTSNNRHDVHLRLGNVSNYYATPPNYNAAIKKGHLKFDAEFECGNLLKVEYISEFEYDLYVRPDISNSRFRVWFYFTVSNNKAGQRAIFNIVNFSKTKSLYRDGMAPVIKSTTRPKWVRLSAKNAFYYRSPDHDNNYVMSFAVVLDKENEEYSFAYCYPYSYSKLQRYLDAIEARSLRYVRRECIALTLQHRRLDMITITSPGNLQHDVEKKLIFISARVHPGESPSSYVCQGIIDFLISDSPAAKILRDNLVFKIVPMLNPDGVSVGNYRCSLAGDDLNRHWHDPTRQHPTLSATKDILMEHDSDNTCNVEFYVDIHGHTSLVNAFIYGNIFDDSTRFEKQSIFPKLLSNNADDFSMAKTCFNKDAVKAGTGRRFLGSYLNPNALCYTLEVSCYGYQNVANSITPYTEEGFMRLGRSFAKTFVDYYELNGCVSELVAERAAAAAIRRKNAREREGNKGKKQTGDRDIKETRKTDSQAVLWNSSKQNYEG